jgi:hypothetical protein
MIPFDLASNLNRTWIIDLDGTVFKHNGYKEGKDILLTGVKELWNSFLPNDMIIIVTARDESERDKTIDSLIFHQLKFDKIIFGAPTGERIVINDIKPEGLKTALAWNVERDKGYKND